MIYSVLRVPRPNRGVCPFSYNGFNFPQTHGCTHQIWCMKLHGHPMTICSVSSGARCFSRSLRCSLFIENLSLAQSQPPIHIPLQEDSLHSAKPCRLVKWLGTCHLSFWCRSMCWIQVWSSTNGAESMSEKACSPATTFLPIDRHIGSYKIL